MKAATKAPRTPRAASQAATLLSQKAYVDGVPLRYQPSVRKSFTGGLSPRQAIKVKCLDCSNFQPDEVADCRVVTCPLWLVRPFQTSKKKAAPVGAAEVKNCAGEV